MNSSLSLKPKIIKIFQLIVIVFIIILPHTKILAQYGSISGIVADLATNAPIAGVTVTAPTWWGFTDSAGYYFIDSLALGSYDLYFSKFTYADTFLIGVNVQPGITTYANIEIRQIPSWLQPINIYTLPYPGAARIRLQGDYAYLNSAELGMQIADISIPENTRVVGRMPYTIYTFLDMDINGQYAYLGGGTIHIADISDIHHPVMIDENLLNGFGHGIFVRGNYAYVAAGNYFYVYDVTNPRGISIAGYLEFDNGSHDFRDVRVQGDYAYTADLSRGLTVIDVSDPTIPEIVGYCACNNASDLFVRGNYVYLAADASIIIFDISNPMNPHVTRMFLTSYPIKDIVVQGNYAYLAGFALQVVNIANPSDPILNYVYETSGLAGGVAVSNDYIYIADNNYLVTIRYMGIPMGNIEGIVTDVDSIPLNGAEVELAESRVKTCTDLGGHFLLDHIRAGPCSLTFSLPGYNVVGDANIIVSENQTVTIDKILKPTSAIEGMITDFASRPIKDALVSLEGDNKSAISDSMGNFEFIGLRPGSYDMIFSHPDYHDSLFQNVNVTQNETTYFEAQLRPSTEVEFLGSCSISGNAFGLVLQDNYLYTASANSGMYIINIANAQSPVVASQYGTPAWAWEVRVRDDLAYIAEGAYGVEIVNISNPLTPLHVGNYSDNAALSIDVQGDYAYILEGEWYDNGSLYILNISDPTNPVLVGSYFLVCDLGDRGRVRVKGSYAYFTYSDMLAVLDVSNPANPRLAGSLEDFWVFLPGGLVIDGNYAYTTAYDRNILRIIDISNPQTPNFVGINYNFTNTRPLNLSVRNGFAYSADYNTGICIIDVTNNIPFPAVVANYNTAGTPNAVLASGDYIYTVNDDSLMILRFNGTGQVTGTVYYDSAIVSNTAVQLLGWSQCDTTDSNGHFQLNNVHQGLRSINFSHELYGDSTADVDVVLGNTTELNLNYGARTGLQPNSDLPSDFSLTQNYPNPFNPTTTMGYSLPSSGHIKLTVYDILGRRVAIPFDGAQTAGEHKLVWNASAFPSGIYFARLEAGEKTQTIKMVLLK
jgi:hypothetical protein